MLEPDLLEEYRKVAAQITEKDSKYEKQYSFFRFQTRHNDEPFVNHSLFVNIMQTEQDQLTDWDGGVTGLISLGDYDGGDLLRLELGLRITSKPGTVHLVRSQLHHSFSAWQGKNRFRVVCNTPDGVRKWAQQQMGREVSSDSIPTSVEHQLAGRQEDILPEDQRIEPGWELDRGFPYDPDENSDDEDNESEASMHELDFNRKVDKGTKRSAGSGSDASADDERAAGVVGRKAKKAKTSRR